MEVLLVAAKKDKIADYTSVITQAGRTPVIVDVDAFALQNAYEANYGFDAERGRGAAQRRRQRHQHQHPLRRRSRSSRATSRWAATPSPKRCRRSSNLPFEAAEQLKKGQDVDGAQLRGRAAGAARDDRQRAARSREDVRLLQGDRVERSHRSHRAERRRVARRRLRRGAARALRHQVERVRSVPAGRVRRRKLLGVGASRRWRRWRPWPSAWRCARWATDDSHQPPRRRAPRGQGRRHGRSRSARRSRSSAA